MAHLIKKYRLFLCQDGFASSCIVALVFLVASIVTSYITALYATRYASNPVTDLFLDNLPFVDVSSLFIYGAIIATSVFSLFLLTEPETIPFTLKSIGLLVFIRSFFVLLTHIGPFPQQVVFGPVGLLKTYFLGADYFFSGHTGVPFLVSLIFWEKRWLRNVALLTSVTFGTSALLGHLHYSIDVFGAYFITYAVFHLAQKAFVYDLGVFRKFQ